MGVAISDNCTADGALVVTSSDGAPSGSCPWTITRTYTVTDACGNAATVNQTITVDDIIPPTASNLAPISVQCLTDIPAGNILDVTDEADNCGVPVVAFVGDVDNGGTCPKIFTRTYSVTDACGNTINVTQAITVGDNIPPTADALAPISVQCASLIPPSNILDVTGEADNCSVPVVTFVSDVSDNNTCPEVITRTYRVTDACNNFINVTQTITVGDNIAPTANALAPINVQCAGLVPASNIADVTGEADNCTAVPTVTFISDVSDNNTCPEVITRTYRVSDACNNFINLTQTITVGDNTPPTASNPAPIAVQCSGLVPASDITVVTDEADNCTAVPTVTFVSDVTNGLTCPETITRTYRVADACNNSINVTQTITVGDNIDPTATAPAAINVTCSTLVPAADITLIADEADNCSVPVVTFVSDVSNGMTCPEVITRTYRVTDACNNSIDLVQTITVGDNIPPTASNLAPVSVQCLTDIPAGNILDVTDEADNCGVPVVAFIGDVDNGGTCPKIFTRTYSVTDACGNSINVTQAITVGDNIPPTADALAPITVQCSGDVPASNILDVTNEADNCSVPVVTFVGDVSDNNTCPEVITRTYRVTDACNNFIDVVQTITVGDNINPTASNPAPVTVTCSTLVPAVDITVVTDEADNCTAAPVVAWVSDATNGLTCPEIITRTYSVTDACLNTINVTQTITVGDNIDPTASNPAPIAVQCSGLVPASDITVVTDEADNCSVPVVTFVGDVSDGNTCPEVITRTYRVTDACKNSIYVTQTITVGDNIDPTSTAPAAIIVQVLAMYQQPT
jgi:uncharacterized protein YunC (DUF1805 family)